MSDKPSNFQILKAFGLLIGIAVIFVTVSNFVLNVFWNLIFKLITKIVNR